MLPDETLAEWDTFIEEQLGDSDHRLKVAAHRLADAGWSKHEAANLLSFAYNAGYDEGYTKGYTIGSEDGYDEGRADAELEATS